LRERAGNARGAGARSSFGWQTSVGRIARLLHREVARPVGDQERALARKKSVAPPDAGHEWADGETVRVEAVPKKVRSSCGHRVNRSVVLDTTEGVLGHLPVLPLPAMRSKGPRFVGEVPSAHADGRPAHRADRIPTRACLRMTTERQRSIRFGEGSSRSQKGRGGSASSTLEKASASGAPVRSRPKLTTANSFVDPPLP
jgi:hypothetical protein